MNTLFSPGQPGSQNLLVDTDLHMPLESLPASIAPKGHLKPARFRNKGTVCMIRSHGACLAWPRKKPWGKNNKSNHKATERGGYACRGDLGTGHGCIRGPWGHRHWCRGKERWGKHHMRWWPGMRQLPQTHLATEAGAA